MVNFKRMQYLSNKQRKPTKFKGDNCSALTCVWSVAADSLKIEQISISKYSMCIAGTCALLESMSTELQHLAGV